MKRHACRFCCLDCDVFGRGHNVGSTTRSEVYAARFRRAKRLQLGRQVMFEILDGGRIHRQVRGKLLNVLLSGNDRSSLNPSQRSDTWRMVESDGGEAELTSEEK